MILLIDNYDSFSYNLYQLIGEIEPDIKVIRNDELSPDCLRVTARTADGEVMAVQHKEYPIYGVQFHPESIMTPEGKRVLRNFIMS